MSEPRVLMLAIGIFAVLILAYLRPLYDIDLHICKRLGWPKGIERLLDKDSVWCDIGRVILTLAVIASLVFLFTVKQ